MKVKAFVDDNLGKEITFKNCDNILGTPIMKGMVVGYDSSTEIAVLVSYTTNVGCFPEALNYDIVLLHSPLNVSFQYVYLDQIIINKNIEFINNLKSEYATKISTYENKKTRIRAKMARLEKKLTKLIYPHWTDILVRPIMAEVAHRTPDIVWEQDKTLNTFGIRCACPVFGQTLEGHTVGITFTAGKAGLLYDTGEKYHANEYNDLNGLNNISKPIVSIDELVSLVRKQEQQSLNQPK